MTTITRYAITLTALAALQACGGQLTPISQPDASQDDMGACVMASGNCGCVFEETIHYGPRGWDASTHLVCPDR